MRPVSLTLSGLHSYRAPVTIDFSELGRFGLFGIFGQIGSGKSSVLDAMTLALYGQIDRVQTRSRKGLVNLGSDGCEVRLVFMVDGPLGPETYEVHRNYRESDGTAVRIASRLVQKTADGRSVVLADKEREVNESVEEIVGLGAADFMRAVVLPQGRFQQLLHLKGSERRHMLQRIFRLHAYGEGLRKQVQGRQTAGMEALAAARGELAGIGEASPEAVSQARAHAEETQAAREAAQTHHGLVTLQHQVCATARAEHARLAEARRAVAAHRADASTIEAREALIAAAERVEPARGPARRWRAAQTTTDRLRAAAEVAREADAQAQQRLAAAVTARREHQQRLQDDGAAITEEIGRLEAHLDRELQIAQARATVAEETALVAREQAALQGIEEQIATLRAEISAGEGQRREIRKTIRKRRVSREEREATLVAERASILLEQAQARVEEARAQVASRAAGVADAEAAVTEASAQIAHARRTAEAAEAALAIVVDDPGWLPPDALLARRRDHEAAQRLDVQRAERTQVLDARGAALTTAQAADEASQRHLDVAAAEATAAVDVLRGADVALAAAEDQLQAAHRQASVAELVSALAADTPCRICGSPHHPAPASVAAPSEAATPAAVLAHREGRRRAAQRHEGALAAHARAHAAAQATAEATATAAADLDRARDQLAAVEAIPASDAAADLARHHDLEARRTRLEGEVRRAEVALERASAPAAAALAVLEARNASMARAEAEIERRVAEEGDAWAAFDRDRGSLTLFDVGNAMAALSDRDREVEASVAELEGLEGTLGSALSRAEGLAAQCATQQQAIAIAEQRVAAGNGRLEALSRDRGDADVTAGDPRERLDAQRRALADLEAHAELAVTTQEGATATHHEAARRLAEADAEARGAEAALIEAESQLRGALRQLDASGDLDAQLAAIEVAALDDDALARHKAEVARWRDREAALQAHATLLEESSEGVGPPPEADWLALERSLAAAESALAEARERATQAATEAEALAARAPRFDQLQATTGTLDRDLQRLQSLAQVLRGDRFVDFVANDHLIELASRASAHLGALTQGRYGLEVDETAAFSVRDAHAGGAIRPVHTLSGGEGFLTALSLALALSTQVQSRSSRPLGFFFLDEGFGTLDPESLDRVMGAIEALRDDSRVIGLISHVPAIRERVPRYLWVNRADAGIGSTVEVRDN